MADLDFTRHALREMARDSLPPEAVYHVVGDADEVIEQGNRRRRYTGTWEGRSVVVILERDRRTVVTAWERKRDSRRARPRGRR